MKQWFCLIVWTSSTIACTPIVANDRPTSTPASPVLFLTPTVPAEPISPASTVIPPSPEGHPTTLPRPPKGAAAWPARISISAAPPTIKVGQTVSLTGAPVNLGLPYYTLYLKGEPAVTITYDNKLQFQGFTGQFVEFVSASASNTQVEFVLRAVQPGTVKAAINATGEVRLDDGRGNFGWIWGGAGSDTITLTLTAN
ncbi:MAG: hypothetical protein DPW09_02185 [Anaerolineae bacterium]|nr:hypothetical protein [Anaerolineae bacterium]MCQ3972238.1 hypothetical protein [Anaerolineae bacterium]